MAAAGENPGVRVGGRRILTYFALLFYGITIIIIANFIILRGGYYGTSPAPGHRGFKGQVR
jgi:hypothetical protein